jgi:hypothetical protein
MCIDERRDTTEVAAEQIGVRKQSVNFREPHKILQQFSSRVPAIYK